MSMLWCAVSFSALMDGKEFDDLVSFPHRHCIFSPFSELDFWLVEVGKKLVTGHQKWCMSEQVSVGAGRGNEDSFRDDCAFGFSRVKCDKCM